MAILVRGLETREGGGFFDCAARVTLDGRERELVFRRYGTHPRLTHRDDTFDPFAVALLVPAMLRGEPLVIEGDIDEFLLVGLRGLIQETLRLMAPAWRRVAVEAGARPATATTDWTKGAATSMSGGIDSMHLMGHRFLDPQTPDLLRVRTLVHHHVGAHGDDHHVFEEQYAHARRIADRFGLPLVGTRCSLTEAYRGMPYIHSVVPRNVAASLALDHLFSVFHYGSSETLGGRPRMTRFEGIATLEPQLLPLFNTTRAVWMPFGGDATRLRKTADVLAEDHERRFPFPLWIRPAVALALLVHGTRHPLRT